jgi:hypothetical protein
MKKIVEKTKVNYPKIYMEKVMQKNLLVIKLLII